MVITTLALAVCSATPVSRLVPTQGFISESSMSATTIHPGRAGNPRLFHSAELEEEYLKRLVSAQPVEAQRKAKPAVIRRMKTVKPIVPASIAAATLVAAGVRGGAFTLLGGAYSALAMASPLGCAVTTATVKGVASDLFAQLAVERNSGLSVSRTLVFASFGAAYLGAFNCWKYNFFYSALFGSAATVSAIVGKVAIDMFLCAPLVYFPLYFIVKGLFEGVGPRRSIRQYLSPSGLSMLRSFWAVWLPVETFMWIVVPAHLRISFLCGVSLFWQVFLSTRSYRTDGHASSHTSSQPGSLASSSQLAHYRVPYPLMQAKLDPPTTGIGGPLCALSSWCHLHPQHLEP